MLPISNVNIMNVIAPERSAVKNNNDVSAQDDISNQMAGLHLSVKNDPTALILKSAMDKINAQFAPYIGDGTLQKAVESKQDMSPKATADSILSFATQLMGRAQAAQTDLPVGEQRSREHLFQNIQKGVKDGLEQARGILDAMQVLHGKTKEAVDQTDSLIQLGLVKLAALLELSPAQVSLNNSEMTAVQKPAVA